MVISVSLEKHPLAILESLEVGDSAVFRCRFKQWYLPDMPELELLVVALADKGRRQAIRLLLVCASDEAEQALADIGNQTRIFSVGTMTALALAWRTPVIDLSEPLWLEPVSIPKPWGQEIWYTGMEERGLSRVTDGRHSIPLAWLLGVVPTHLMGTSNGTRLASNHQYPAPNLLKILDPLPEPVYGDLYFELHEQKREVYVVTHIDKLAWPGGVGGIRYDFAASARGRYPSERAFRSAYLEVVIAYREVRRQVDRLLDEMRLRDHVGLNEAVSAEQAKTWAKELPAQLTSKEHTLRAAMNEFTELRPLRLGDVVKVPLLTPHALQHGVRTIEFQTPVYERKILSFAQKVLTQDEWDTAEAIALMPLATTDSRDLAGNGDIEVLEDGVEVKRERIVNFQDFQVQRVTLKPKAIWTSPATGAYSLIVAIQGVSIVGGREVAPEQAVFVPACQEKLHMENLSPQPSVLLISQPGNGNI